MTHTPRLQKLATWQLSQASARAHRVLREHLGGEGVSGYDYRVLAALDDLGRLTQTDLGRAAGLDRRDVTHTVRGLEYRQLVDRQTDQGDSRRVVVELRKAGRVLLARLDVVMEEVQSEVLAPLTADQRETLFKLLRRLSE